MKSLSPRVGALVVVAAGAIMLGAFSPYAREVPHDGIPVANCQWVAYRNGVNAWIALTPSFPVGVDIGEQSIAEIQIDTLLAKRQNDAWGGSNFWLKLPAFRINLWWIVAATAVLIVLITTRENSKKLGFPVLANQSSSV